MDICFVLLFLYVGISMQCTAAYIKEFIAQANATPMHVRFHTIHKAESLMHKIL